MADNNARMFGAAGAAAEQARDLVQNTCSTATKGMKDYSLKMLEIAQANSDAAFDYARRLWEVKSPSEMMELCTAHVRKQFEVMTQQTNELATIGQKAATETAAPLASAAKKASEKVA